MNKRVLKVLEFDKVRNRLEAHASTSLGKELVQSLEPSSDYDEVLQRQQETDEAAQIVRLDRHLPLGGISDIRPSIKRSQIGGVLSPKECLDVANTIYGGRQVKKFFEQLELNLPYLKSLAEQITPLRELEQRIKHCIDDQGNVADEASMTLRTIRREIRSLEERIRSRLEQYTRTNSKYLSDAIVTIRNDRYVLPVKQEYRSIIGGVVHDQSASGQTLFMEPKAVVELNNQLQEKVMKEAEEIERILRELSRDIGEAATLLTENVAALAQIDFIYARALFGREMRAVTPNINNEGVIKMQLARHPLIPLEEVVANDIAIGEDYTAIVITGPNTGGKTVTLKMVGLCTLMAQAGLQVPALDGCTISVFKEVFADIGDEQSIEQNLSTFSSHMTNIVDIIGRVNHESLVLFDELGSGTDPSEGAALAMAILDEVIDRGARVIATTHYPELKAYGYNRKQVVNASVEFDVETLQPTYRLMIGIPGRSNAFEISQRLGLDERIIQRAKGLIGLDSKNVENMIASLEQSKLQAEKDYEKAHEILAESEQLREELLKAWNQFQHEKEILYKKAEEKAEKAVQKAREEAEKIVADLRNRQHQAQFKEHEWIERKKLLDELAPDLTDKQENTETRRTEQRELHPGDEIILTTVNQKGEVLKKVSDNEYIVQVGIMKVKVERKNLQFVGKKKQETENPIATIKGANYHVPLELDLRGERYEDALRKLEKYIDDSLLAGYPKVTIIHGKGTGALRKGVQEFVKSHPSIAAFRPGGSGEGGSGVTVIEFK